MSTLGSCLRKRSSFRRALWARPLARSVAVAAVLLAVSGCGRVKAPALAGDAGVDAVAPDALPGADTAAPAPLDAREAPAPQLITACAGGAPPVTPAPAATAAAELPTGPYAWQSVAIVAGGFVSGVVFSPAQRDVIYARTDIGGAYRWNAASRRWMPLLDWVSRSSSNWAGVESIAADPRDANKVYIAAGTYVASGNGAFLRSSDGGNTFDVTTTTIPMGGNNDGRSVGERLIVDPNQPSTLYFGSRTMGLWKSTDSSVTWAQMTSPPGLTSTRTAPLTTPNGVGMAFVLPDPGHCGPAGQTVIYAGVAVTDTSLFRSADGGLTWAAVPGQPAGLLPSHAALSATGQMYITYGGGTGINGDGPNNVTTGAVFRLDVASDTFTDVTPASPSAAFPFGYAGVSVDAAHPDTVVISTLDRWSLGDDIFRTTDAGATWQAVNLPEAPHDVSAAPWVTFHAARPNYTGWMADVEIDPFDSGRVLHVTGQGIWATDDITGGADAGPTQWDFRSAGIEETAVLDLISPPSGPHLLSAVGDIGGFRHDDLSVSPPDGMSQNPLFTNTDGIDFAEQAPAVVARVGRTLTGDGPNGGYSTDGGTTWQPFAASLPVTTGSAGSIAVSADGATFVWDPPAGPQVSRDSGATWTPSAGIGAIRPVVADRVNPHTFYAFDTTGRFYVSNDGAATFTVAATGLPTGTGGRPRATPGIEGDVWLITRSGLRHSTNGGVAFSAVTSASAVVALGFGMAPPGGTYPALYLIGTVGQAMGVFRSDDAGATWTRLDDAQHTFPTGDVIAGDPRLYGRVYVGTNGRGIFYGDPIP
jgi:BNR/Asp-box repeat